MISSHSNDEQPQARLVLNIPILDREPSSPRRFGLHVAWISIVFVIALIALRGWVVWHVITNVAPCPACMAATAMQQDSVLLGIFLTTAAAAFLFRAYILQLPFLIFGAVVILVMAIDSVVLLTLTQRLYVFDVLKFGKELGAITQFARIFLESTTGKSVGLMSIFGLVLLACLFAPRPRRLRAALVLLLAGAISIAFGSWRPSTMSYIHYEVLQNVLAANLELGVDRAYAVCRASTSAISNPKAPSVRRSR